MTQKGGEAKYADLLYKSAYEEANTCIQCGYCLPACPTYVSMGKEAQSPRGRINLVKMAAEGKIDVKDNLSNPIDLCLGCRACEVACPVGVPYGHILESAKEVIAKKEMESYTKSNTPKWKYRLTRITLKQLFPYPRRLRLLGNVMWFGQKTGMLRIVRKTKWLQKISRPMAAFEEVLPTIDAPAKRLSKGTILPAKGEKKASVAFFSGCIMDAMLHKTNRLSIELLTHVGCEVIIPETQTCCGALHSHQGFKEEAIDLAKRNITAFEQSQADYYINNAGGCGAALKEYDHLLSSDAAWKERAEDFVNKSRDITELLVQFDPLPYQKEWHGIITYQDSCHLRNVQGVIQAPRTLLQSIPGATYVELEHADSCCASGGIYNLLHYDESMTILDEKMTHVHDTKANTIVTTNPGCLLQMQMGVNRKGNSSQAVKHIVEVLAEACGIT